MNKGTMGVNSLPKTVTRQRRDCDLNQGHSAPVCSTLTTRLPSHPPALQQLLIICGSYRGSRVRASSSVPSCRARSRPSAPPSPGWLSSASRCECPPASERSRHIPINHTHRHTHTHTRLTAGPFSGTTPGEPVPES